MPRLDDYGVLEEIKQRQEFNNLPIAMLTSRSNEKIVNWRLTWVL